jgi:hypothetical protein
MNLICVISSSDSLIEGYASTADVYLRFEVRKGQDIVVIREMPISEYHSYETFAAVIGKFEPYSFFFRVGVPILEENFDGVKAAYEKHVKEFGEPL